MKKRLIITEEEQNRILKMHKTAINDSYLNNFNGKKITIKEQILDDDGPEETPKESEVKKKIEDARKKGKDVFDKLKDKIIPKDKEGDEEGDEEDGLLDIFKGHKTNKMDEIVKKAWEAVKIYANANKLKRKTMFSEDNKNVWQYYTIKGIDFYDDGYKVINPAKPEEQERYSEDDDALTIENKPLVTVVPDNKSETKVTNEPLIPTPTPTKKIISTNDDNF